MRARATLLTLLLLALPASALAAAGGGTSSYGGGYSGGGSSYGGGYSGGGSSYGGGGYGGYGGSSDYGGGYSGGYSGEPISVDGSVLLWTFGILLGIIFLVWVLTRIKARTYSHLNEHQSPSYRKPKGPDQDKLAARDQELIALTSNYSFNTEKLKPILADKYHRIQEAWSVNDTQGLSLLVGGDLLEEWKLRLEDFKAKSWLNTVRIKGLNCYITHITARGDDLTVVAYFEAELEDFVTDKSGNRVYHNADTDQDDDIQLNQWWSFKAKAGDDWVLCSVEEIREGTYHLEEDNILEPSENYKEIREEAVKELAANDTVKVGEIINPSFGDEAQLQVSDLSVMDARFSEDLIGTSLQEILAAYLEAIDGDNTELEKLAEAAAINQALYSDADGRWVMRGIRVQEFEVTSLTKTHMGVQLTLEGIIYQENRNTLALEFGDRGTRTTQSFEWQLSLTEDPQVPWKLSSARPLYS